MMTPSNVHCNGLTPEQIDQIRKNGAEETIRALSNSDDLFNDPVIICTLCYEPYHTEFEPGITEFPFMSACGHVFGAACLKKWLKEHNTCPACDFNYVFSCGHPTSGPRKAFAPIPPNLTAFGNHKAKCQRCTLKPINKYWQAKVNVCQNKMASARERLARINVEYGKILRLRGDFDCEVYEGLRLEPMYDLEKAEKETRLTRNAWAVDVSRVKEGFSGFWAADLV